jgi:RNA polymerase sigma factor (sigma-70 family)
VHAHAEPGAAHALGIDEAFERLYRSYARDVYRYTLAVLRNPADAEDITQTTFLNAYRAYRRGEEPERPRNWLIKIAHNACRSRHLRAVRRPQEVPFEETIAAIPAPAEETPKLEELLEALGQLPFNQRAALVMRELEGRSYAEIADTLEVSVAAVETLIFRARRTLRRDRSLLGVLGSVQLPPSLGSFFGGGGGAVAGGGIAIGSGLLVKAALLVAAGVVAGALGPIVGADVLRHGKPAAMALSPLPAPSTSRSRTVLASAPTTVQVLRGPMVLVKRQGRTFVVTEGVAGTSTVGVPFEGSIGLLGGTAPQTEQLPGATAAESTPAPAAAGTAGAVPAVAAPDTSSATAAVPSTGSATQAVTTTAKNATSATTATTPVTQAVSSVTSTASAPLASPPPPSLVTTPTVSAPPPPPLPVDTSPVTSALPPTPTVTLPDLP